MGDWLVAGLRFCGEDSSFPVRIFPVRDYSHAMKLPIYRSLFAVLVVSFVSAPAFSQGQGAKVSLRPTFVAGKKYVLSQDIETTTKLPVPNAAGEQKIEMKMGMEMKVKQVNPKEKKVSLEFTEMKMKTEMAGQKIDIDAKDPAQKAAFGPILNMKPVMVYDGEDEFIRMEGMDEVMAGPMAKMMNPDALKQMVNGSLESMPKEPVSVGHSWKQTVSVPLEGAEMKIDVQYKFEKMEELDGVNCAVLTFAGNLSGDLAEIAQGISMKIEEGLFTGTIHFDPKIKYIRRQESRNRFVMKMKVPQQAEEMVIPMDQKQVVKLTSFVDLAPGE